MNMPSNALPSAALELQPTTPALESPTRPFYWSVRRELWEYRSIYVAPLAAAAVFLFGFAISMFRLPAKMRALSGLEPTRQRELIEQPYVFAALLIMGTTFVVAIFYCLDTLHGERRDRSILFWKSLPVSDLTTVLAKASIPLVILPLVTVAITLVTHWIMFLLSTMVLASSNVGAAVLWTHLSLGRMSLLLLYHLVAVHSLWYSPFYCWLLLVSAWARRMAFLWAVIPVILLNAFERVVLNTSHFAGILVRRMSGSPHGGDMSTGHMSMDVLSAVPLSEFLSAPGLWIGLFFAAIFLAGAVRLRRYREPI
jgi:ABC-2 type transport system permease protein